jgi:hypothetical protein
VLVRGPFREDAVRATIEDARRPSTPELDARIERRWNEALARAAHERRELFDGAVLRWLRHEIDVAPPSTRLHVFLGRGAYREFVGTNLDPTIRPDLAGGSIPWSQYANAVGTSAIVATRDGVLVAGRRSDRVLGFRGHVHSFGGILEAIDAHDGAVDVFASLRRELAEELALAAEESRALVLNGVTIDPILHQPEMVFRASVPVTAAELRERWRRAPSRDEHSELLEFPDDPAAIEAALNAAAPVSPVARACFALHFDARPSRDAARPGRDG